MKTQDRRTQEHAQRQEALKQNTRFMIVLTLVGVFGLLAGITLVMLLSSLINPAIGLTAGAIVLAVLIRIFVDWIENFDS